MVCRTGLHAQLIGLLHLKSEVRCGTRVAEHSTICNEERLVTRVRHTSYYSWRVESDAPNISVRFRYISCARYSNLNFIVKYVWRNYAVALVCHVKCKALHYCRPKRGTPPHSIPSTR